MASYLKENLISSMLAKSYNNIRQKLLRIHKASSDSSLHKRNFTRGTYRTYSFLNLEKKVSKTELILPLQNNTLKCYIEKSKSNVINHSRGYKRKFFMRQKLLERLPNLENMYFPNSVLVKGRHIEKPKLRSTKTRFVKNKERIKKIAIRSRGKYVLPAPKIKQSSESSVCPQVLPLRCKNVRMSGIKVYKGRSKKKAQNRRPRPIKSSSRSPKHLLKKWRKQFKSIKKDIYKKEVKHNLKAPDSSFTDACKANVKPLPHLKTKTPLLPETSTVQQACSSPSVTSVTKAVHESNTGMSIYKLVSTVACYLEAGMQRDDIVQTIEKAFKKNCIPNKTPNLWKVKLSNCSFSDYQNAPPSQYKKLESSLPNFDAQKKASISYPKSESHLLRYKKKNSLVSMPNQENLMHPKINYSCKNSLKRYQKIRSTSDVSNTQSY